MSVGLSSLATIIKRLEAATSRLEDLAERSHSSAQPDDLEDVSTPGSTYVVPAAVAPATQTPAPTSQPSSADPKFVIAFDERVLNGKLQPFLDLTKSFAGASLVDQAALVEKEYKDLRALLLVAGSCLKPDQKAFGELLKPLLADIEAINRLKEANRKDRDWFTHLSTLAEGAPVVGWVTADPKPGPYINDIKDSTLFYGNRVIKEYKEKDQKHAEWVRAYIALLEETRSYVTEYHTTGLVWNPKGVPVEEFIVSKPTAQGGSGAPPPPPPPPPPPTAATQPSSSTPAGGAAAVFAAINRGEDVTKGLRKVDKSEMTHKNPSLRGSAPVSTNSSTSIKRPQKPTKPKSLMMKKPAKLALEGSKWIVEYQENESGLVIENVELNQTVNLYGCKNSTIVIKGKANAVTIVDCTKTAVLVESVISAVSITKSPSFTLQITGSAPTIQLDSTDSGQIYLSKDCLGVEINTAKCSSINVSLPVEGEEDGVFEEQAVPEMLKTVVKDGKLVTSVVEHVG